MSPTTAPKVRFTKEELLSPDLELPSRECAPDAIKFNFFDWLLFPFEADKERVFKLSCTVCSKVYKMKWPFNTTTLKSHIHGRHFNTIIMLQNQALDSDDPVEDSILRSSLAISGGRFTPTLENLQGVHIGQSSGASYMLTSNRVVPSHSFFQISEYRARVLRFITANSLPFIVLDSPTFKDLLKYLKEDLPGSVTRYTIKDDLHTLFWKEMRRLKGVISKNSGRFSLTMDEWNCSNNLDFLAITLHFYNNSFELETYNIGFEYLNESTSYTGEIIFGFLEQILGIYGLSNRVISITRDNAGPINTCLKMFKESLSLKGIDFTGDIRCAGHVFNLAIETVLNYSFFRVKRTRKFETSLNEINRLHPELEDLALSMKALPGVVRSIISGMRHNHYLKNSFSKAVLRKKAARASGSGPEVLLRDNDTRWLSTYKMIDRFLYFKEEIKELLRGASVRNRSDDLNLESCEITELEWDYLANLRDILDAFRGPTIKLQASKYSTVNRTIPCVLKLLNSLEGHYTTELKESNPYLALGVLKAREKLLEYFPVFDDNIEKMKDLYLATVLDPRYKVAFFQDVGFSDDQVTEIKNYFYEVFERYLAEWEKENEDVPVEIVTRKRRREAIETTSLEDSEDDYFLGREEDAVEHEIDVYLKQGRMQCHRPIEYYRDRKATFPVIGRMARDFLAMPAMSAPAESLFSQVGDIVSNKRNRLSPTMIKILALMKSRGKIPDETDMVDENHSLSNDSGGQENEGNTEARPDTSSNNVSENQEL